VLWVEGDGAGRALWAFRHLLVIYLAVNRPEATEPHSVWSHYFGDTGQPCRWASHRRPRQTKQGPEYAPQIRHPILSEPAGSSWPPQVAVSPTAGGGYSVEWRVGRLGRRGGFMGGSLAGGRFLVLRRFFSGSSITARIQ